MTRIRLLLAPVSFLVFSSMAYAQVDAPKDLKNKVLAHWASVLESIQTARWEEEIQIHSTLDPKRPTALTRLSATLLRRAYKRKVGWLGYQKRDSFHADQNVRTRDSGETITLVNAMYTANLSKKADQWLLSKLWKPGENAEAGYASLDTEPFLPWMTVGNVCLVPWLQEPSFVFARIEQLPLRPPSVVYRVHFVYDGTRNPTKGIKSGFLDLDPAHSYRPLAYHYQIKSAFEDGFMRGSLEYENSEGIPVLKAASGEVQSRLNRKGRVVDVRGKETQTFSQVQYNGRVMDTEFRLSQYDLPEPNGVVWPSSTRWWLWITLGAVVCAGLAFGFARLKRRLARTVTGDKTL